MGALRLSSLSLGQRLLLALGAMLLPLVAIGVIGLLSLHGADQDNDAITRELAVKSSALATARRRLERAESSAVRYYRTRNADERERLPELARELSGHFDALERLHDGAEEGLARRSRRSW